MVKQNNNYLWIAAIIAALLMTQPKITFLGSVGETNSLDNPSFETDDAWNIKDYNAPVNVGSYSTDWVTDGQRSFKFDRKISTYALSLWQDVDLTNINTITFDYYPINPAPSLKVVIGNVGQGCQGSTYPISMNNGVGTLTIPTAEKRTRSLCFTNDGATGVMYLDNLQINAGACTCTSGECCSDGCHFNAYNTQPVGYTDYWFCQGNNRVLNDYYCTGSSAIKAVNTNSQQLCEYGCSGSTCILACTIPGDTPPACDGIDRAELGQAISKWIAGTMTRAELGQAIVSWVS